MRKWIVWALLVACMASSGYAQLREMPKEVRAFLDNYVRDSTAKWGPLSAIGSFLADSIQLKDLRVRAVEVYTIKTAALETHSDTIPLSEIISPSGYWRVLITAHNKPLYELEMTYDGIGKPNIGMMFGSSGSYFGDKVWEPLLENYPETTGITPVFVITDERALMNFGMKKFGGEGNFFYFWQKGPRRIHYVQPPRRARGGIDSLAILFPNSIRDLDDSKKLIGYLKKRELTKKKNLSNERMGQQKVKTNGINENAKQHDAPSKPLGVFIENGSNPTQNDGIADPRGLSAPTVREVQ